MKRISTLIVICLAAFGGGSALAFMGAPKTLENSSFVDATHLLDLRQGSALSRQVRNFQGGGYELSNGQRVSFRDWYETSWQDVHLTWLTQVNKNFGLIFGLGTGERGAKYSIAPSLSLGFIAQAETGKNALLTFRAVAVMGGALKEKTCSADYGELGGVKEVNCRLAASELAPEDTLAYLLNEKPQDRLQLSLRWTLKF